MLFRSNSTSTFFAFFWHSDDMSLSYISRNTLFPFCRRVNTSMSFFIFLSRFFARFTSRFIRFVYTTSILQHGRDGFLCEGARFMQITPCDCHSPPPSYRQVCHDAARANGIPVLAIDACKKLRIAAVSSPRLAKRASASCDRKIGRASCRKECRSRWSPYH